MRLKKMNETPGSVILITDKDCDPIEVVSINTGEDSLYHIIRSYDQEKPDDSPHMAWYCVLGKGWIRWL